MVDRVLETLLSDFQRLLTLQLRFGSIRFRESIQMEPR